MARTFSPSEYIGSLEASIRSPESAAPALGAALVSSGSLDQLGWTPRAVLVEPVVAPANNSQYYAADRTWKSIPEVTSGSIQSALGYTPANDSQVVKLTGDQTVGGTKNFSGYLQVGYSGFNQGNTDIYKYANNAQLVQHNASSQIHNLLRTDAANLLGATTFSGPITVPGNVSTGSIVFGESDGLARIRSSGTSLFLEGAGGITVGGTPTNDVLLVNAGNNATPITRVIGYANNAKPQLGLYTKSGQTAASLVFGDSSLVTLAGLSASAGVVEINNGTTGTLGSLRATRIAGASGVGIDPSNQGLVGTIGFTNTSINLTPATIIRWQNSYGAPYTDSNSHVGLKQNGTNTLAVVRGDGITLGTIQAGTLQQGAGTGNPSARFRMLAAGQRVSEVGDGAGVWQSGYREEYNAGGIRSSIFGKTPIAQLVAPAVATDLASAITAVNTHTVSLTSFGLYV